MDEHKKYLTETVPQLLKKLRAQDEPVFGIMTAQHMVEHLIWVTKSSVKDFGPPPKELAEKQLNFMRFVNNGANFKHRPSDKNREDLAPPRMPSLQDAIDVIPDAISRLYNNPGDKVFFNPMMGRLSFSEMELFHSSHYRYHLEEQFGLHL